MEGVPEAMRISANKKDDAYSAEAGTYQPYLDGKRVAHCHTADEERGEVIVYEQDDKGHFVRLPGMKGIAAKTLYGKVEIRPERVPCGSCGEETDDWGPPYPVTESLCHNCFLAGMEEKEIVVVKMESQS